MRKKKKDAREKHAREPEITSGPVVPASIGQQLGAALRGAGLQKLKKEEPKPRASVKAAPPPSPSAKAAAVPSAPPEPAKPPPQRLRSKYSAGDLAALNDAYRGVRPMPRATKAERVTSAPKPAVIDPAALEADRQARERLGALVGEGVRFDIQLERDGYVQALRQGASRKQLATAQSSAFAAEATLDLHGKRAAEAAQLVHDFVRSEHRRGARRLLVIVGKGSHSEDGVGVLAGIAREALSRGGAAPLVQAFASAHETRGGRGAIAVLLR